MCIRYDTYGKLRYVINSSLHSNLTVPHTDIPSWTASHDRADHTQGKMADYSTIHSTE